MEDLHVKTKAKKAAGKVAKETDTAIIEYTAPVYFTAVGVLYLLYIITFLGFYNVNPIYIKYLSIFVRILICFFLIYRFNPFRTAVLHQMDTKLIFAAAMLLIIDMLSTEFSLGTFTSFSTKTTTSARPINRNELKKDMNSILSDFDSITNI
jgi:hypothetical protein